MADYPPLPSMFDVPGHLVDTYAAAWTHNLLIRAYAKGLASYIHAPELEAPTRFWYQCADTRLDPCPQPTRYCWCEEAPYGCGGCCSCLSGCQKQHEEAEHWAKRLREMSGEPEPCSCWPDDVIRPMATRALAASSVWHINPACPHHGDARHVCNVSALGRSKHMEGAGWRCPPCGATWVLTRVQGAEQPVRLYPTMQWIRSALEKA